MIYFDYNATTPLAPEAEKAWLEASQKHWQNPSSLYRTAAHTRNQLEHCRQVFAELIGSETETLIFNSGATEGNNALFCAFAEKYPAPARVAVSAIEHSCVLDAAYKFFGNRLDIIPTSAQGIVSVEALKAILENPDIVLISVMAANNETGVIQPWQEIAKICQQNGHYYHCDASQWLGKMPAKTLGYCDFITGCAHKFGGPKGTGFMRVSNKFPTFASLLGGEQEKGYRAGTENYPAVASMLTALQKCESNITKIAQQQITYRNTFIKKLFEVIPGTHLVGADSERLWNTVMLILPHYQNTRWVMRLDKLGFAISIGAACTSSKETHSHVLGAMGYSDESLKRAIRISAGWETSIEQWQSLADAFIEVKQALDNEVKWTSHTKTTVIEL